MQIAELVSVDLDRARVAELQELLQGAEVDVIGRVDRLGSAEDAVGHGHAAAELGGVFYVVDPVMQVSDVALKV